MFKKLVPLLCVSMLSVMPNSSFAGGPDFESLFGKNSSQQLVFNMCGGGDGELKDICRNLNSDLSYTFSSNHTLTITTPDGKQTAKWKAKGQEVYVTQPGSSSFKEASEYTFCEGQYLASYSEESGDLIAMKMQKPRSVVPGSFEQEYISYLNDNKILREADSLLNGRLKAITAHMTPQGREVLISDQKNWTAQRPQLMKQVLDAGRASSLGMALGIVLEDRISYLSSIGFQKVPGTNKTYYESGYVEGHR